MHRQLFVFKADRLQPIFQHLYSTLEIFLRIVRKNNRELVAAVAIAVLRAENVYQCISGLFQQIVSHRMTEIVVDSLEIVYIQHHKMNVLFAVEIVVPAQRKAVPYTGQRVPERGGFKSKVVLLKLIVQLVELANVGLDIPHQLPEALGKHSHLVAAVVVELDIVIALSNLCRSLGKLPQRLGDMP